MTEEIISNARRDRARLEAAADGLTHGFSKTATMDEDEPLDPDVAAAFAEELTGLSEALTNVNKSLVELVKLEVKNAPVAEDPSKLSKEQIDDVFEEIQPQEKMN